MKKVISVLLLTVMLISMSTSVLAYNGVTMYAPDGRTTYVNYWDVTAYENVGWYRYPVQTLYAPGKSKVFAKADVPAQLTVGWYTEPVVYMYSADGRTLVVKQSEVNAYKAVGWDNTMTYVYASDGRYKLIPKIQVNLYRKVNWMTEGEYIGYKAEVTKNNSGYAQAMAYLDSSISRMTDAGERGIVENKRASMRQAWRASLNWAPVAILGCSVTKDSETGTPIVNIQFRNVSTKTVTYLETVFTCYDMYGNVTTDYSFYNGNINGYTYEDIAPDGVVTYSWKLSSNTKTTRVSWPVLTEARMDDGSTWYK